jgi:GNAT superfamily N-acetyltransferase
MTASCATGEIRTTSESPDVSTRHGSLAIWVRQPWMLRVGDANLLIRGTSARDLGPVGAMHARCSPRSLLDRYRSGGRAPSAVAIERALRRTLGFVACTARGEVVAMAVASTDPMHSVGSAEVGMLVEDTWQRRGLGREMLTHLAGAAFVCGYTELIAYTATSVAPAQRLLTDVGRTYLVPDPPTPHLHTYLSESSSLGLGAIREHLAS